jgi:D-alanyl-D-alanine carboxypeptidase (penicillin-binding protein 5/6)
MLRLLAAFVLLLAACAAPTTAPAAFETRAGSAWVYDVGTGTVLLEKNADVPLPPASMSKLMTLWMLFEALRDGRVTMDTAFAVSARAKAMGGSTMFLNEQDRPTVRDLILGIIVNSGNDACVVVAEALAGTEEAFARLATDRARALGLSHTTLANASGWPHPDHRMSMEDLGLLTVRMQAEFPEYYAYFDEREFDYKGRSPANRFNRNPLFRAFPPGGDQAIRADGLKTGHTQEAGFGLVGSAVQGERRVVFVISGLPTDAARVEESQKIVNWAFRQFSDRLVARAGQRVAAAEVWMGAAPEVGLVPARDARMLVPAAGPDQPGAHVVYRGPVQAPVAAGQALGELVLSVPGFADRRIPLVAEAAVAPGGLGTRLSTAARVLIGRAGVLPAF